MKNKVLCPNDKTHDKREKILMAYDSELKRFWVPCLICHRWVQIDINENGGVKTTLMPKDYHFGFEPTASIVEGA